MTSRAELELQVAERADGRCEYCRRIKVCKGRSFIWSI
jgi:hypothetical protein